MSLCLIVDISLRVVLGLTYATAPEVLVKLCLYYNGRHVIVSISVLVKLCLYYNGRHVFVVDISAAGQCMACLHLCTNCHRLVVYLLQIRQFLVQVQ